VKLIAGHVVPHRDWRRAGVSTVEVLVAIALLTAAVVAVGRFAVSANSGLRHRELSARLDWELVNARERIGSWNLAEVTKQRIESLPFSDALAPTFANPRWVAEVKQIEQPARAIQVTLQMHCLFAGQPAIPEKLTFWLAVEE
jgi:predicted lysophospholipase L1 biosynthesis ABC-type transport system permease subunit